MKSDKNIPKSKSTAVDYKGPNSSKMGSSKKKGPYQRTGFVEKLKVFDIYGNAF